MALAVWMKKYFLYTLFVLVAAIGICLASKNIFEHIEDSSYVSNKWAKYRALESLQYLKSHTDKLSKTVPVFGASEMECTFQPTETNKILSASGKDLTIINMAVRNFTMNQMEAQLVEVQKIVRSSGKKFPMVILDIPLNMLTKKVEDHYKTQSDDEMLISFSDYKTLLALSRYSIPEKLSLVLKKLLFERYDPEIAANYFFYLVQRKYDSIVPAYLDETTKQSRRLEFFIYRLWYDNLFHPFPAWDPEKQGEFQFNQPDSHEDFAKVLSNVKSPEGRELTKLFAEICCDVSGLKFSEELVKLMETNIEILKTVSDTLVLTNLPFNPDLNIPLETTQRSREFLNQLANKHGVKIYYFADYYKPTPEQYMDSIHLIDQGQQSLNQFLADVVGFKI